MPVLLIYDQEGYGIGSSLAESIRAVVLPSRKILTREEDDYLIEYLGEYADRWKENSELRHSLADDSKDFLLENFPGDNDMSPPNPDAEEMPISAFYWMILTKFDSQSMSSGIFSDDEARELLQEGGWFEEGWFNGNKEVFWNSGEDEAQDKKEKSTNPEVWWIYDGRGVCLGNVALDATGSYSAQISKDENNPYFDELIEITGPLGHGGDEFNHSVVITDVDKDKVIEAYNNAGFAVILAGDRDHEEILLELDKLRNVHSAKSVSRSASAQLELDHYTEEIGIHPEQPGGYRGRGAVYFELEEYGPAIEDWSAAIALDPENVDDAPYNNLALAYRKVGEYNRAVELYTRAIELDPNWDYRYYTRGGCYLEMGEYRLAIADYNICIWIFS